MAYTSERYQTIKWVWRLVAGHLLTRSRVPATEVEKGLQHISPAERLRVTLNNGTSSSDIAAQSYVEQHHRA